MRRGCESGRKIMSFLLAIKALCYAQIRYTLHYVAASAGYLIGHKKEPRLVGSKSGEESDEDLLSVADSCCSSNCGVRDDADT